MNRIFTLFFFIFIVSLSSCVNTRSTANFEKPREKVEEVTTSSEKADPSKSSKSDTAKKDKEDGKKEKEEKEGPKPCEGKVTGSCSFEMSQEKYFIESRENSLLVDEPRCLKVYTLNEKDERVIFDKAIIDIIKKNETYREKKEIKNEQNETDEYILNYFAMEIDVKLEEKDSDAFRTNMSCIVKNKIE